MRLNPRKLILFAVQFAVLFVALLIVYWAIMPAYQPVVLGSANFVLDRMEPPTRMEIDAGEWRAFDMDRNLKRIFMYWEPWVPHLIFLSIALLPALLLATPAPYKRRLQMLAIGVLPLFLLHVLAIIWIVRGNYVLMYVNPDSFLARWTLKLAYMSGQAFAVALWALLSWRFWFLPAEDPPKTAPPSTDVPG